MILATVTSTAAAALNPALVTPDQIPTLVEAMARAFGSGSWALASGLLLTLVVLVLRMFSVTKHIPKVYVPWAVAGISLLTSVAIGLQVGEGWWQIVTTGVAVALIAVGGWETIAKVIKKFMIKKGWIKSADDAAQ